MTKINLFFFFFILHFSAWSEENIPHLAQQAEALWEARDYSASSKLYEQILAHPLPKWQHTRALYNFATLMLSQNQSITALQELQKIIPTDLSLPRFGRDLFLNQGIAYLQYAETSSSRPSIFLDRQVLFIEQSLLAFQRAQDLQCQIEQIEQEEHPSACHPLKIIDQWAKTAHLRLNSIYQQKRLNWMEQADIETLAGFLHAYLNELLIHLRSLQPSDTSDVSMMTYFQHQTESFAPIWKSMKQKNLTSDQKNILEQANSFYSKSLEDFAQNNADSALRELGQTVDALGPLIFQENLPLQQLRLRYQILLLRNSFTITELKNLLTQFEQLKIEKQFEQPLKKIKDDLQISMDAMQANHLIQARFFLLDGFSQIESLFKTKKRTAALQLKNALEQANRASQLFLLSGLIPDDDSRKPQIQTVLKGEQQSVLADAKTFIPTVLDEQKEQFQKNENPATSCQRSPWEQVIPLFSHGLQAARSATKQLEMATIVPLKVMSAQEQTVNDWQEALNLLLHPPQQNRSNTIGQKSPNSPIPKNLAESFRLIQEMFLQDQSQPAQNNQELHSW